MLRSLTAWASSSQPKVPTLTWLTLTPSTNSSLTARREALDPGRLLSALSPSAKLALRKSSTFPASKTTTVCRILLLSIALRMKLQLLVPLQLANSFREDREMPKKPKDSGSLPEGMTQMPMVKSLVKQLALSCNTALPR